MGNKEYLNQIEAMKDWWKWEVFPNKTRSNFFKITLLQEGMYQCVADEIQRCINAREYRRSDYLIKKLCETGGYWDWKKYQEKVIPAYIYSQSKRRPGNIPGNFPSCLQVYRKNLMYTRGKQNFVIEGQVSFGDIYLKRDLI